MSALVYSNALGSFDLSSGLAIGNDVATAAVISLFSDGRARPDDALPDNGGRRGCWTDSYTEQPIGSRLWTVAREKVLPDVVDRVEQYARQALDWMRADNVADVHVSATRSGSSAIELAVDIHPRRGAEPSAAVADERRIDLEIDGISVAAMIRVMLEPRFFSYPEFA